MSSLGLKKVSIKKGKNVQAAIDAGKITEADISFRAVVVIDGDTQNPVIQQYFDAVKALGEYLATKGDDIPEATAMQGDDWHRHANSKAFQSVLQMQKLGLSAEEISGEVESLED